MLESNSYLKVFEFDTVAWAQVYDSREAMQDRLESIRDRLKARRDRLKARRKAISVPEPGTMLMLGGVLLGLVAVSRKRFKTRN